MPATRERTNPRNGSDNRRGELMRATAQLYDWRLLPAPYRRRLVELKDCHDALWQTTLDALHAEGRLGADARIARLMILGAINFSATWYRARPRGRAGVDLDTLAAETTALFLREVPP